MSDATNPDIELPEAIARVIPGRSRDLGGFGVRRVLPAPFHKTVGPFIFFDHMGPTTLEPGNGLDVRPHPHINLATVTYLFEGEFTHRDSLGTEKVIRPGAVNWMMAGRGIAHSERSSAEQRAKGSKVHGIQSWVALPTKHEEDPPSFRHYPSDSIPTATLDGASLRVVVGTAFGVTSPVEVLSPTLYVDARLRNAARLPLPEEYEERAVYVVDGALTSEGRSFGTGEMVIYKPGRKITVEATADTHLMVLGGAPLDGPRLVWWNFVSSSQERIDRAKADWKAGRFGKVPGDEVEFIPLPER